MEEEKDLGGFFAVSPKYDCGHIGSFFEGMAEVSITAPCKVCADARENWVCVQCGEVFCSRFVGEHMVRHFEQTAHPIALSFTDLSFWCYSCESYVASNLLKPTVKVFQDKKFPNLNNEN